MKELKLTSLNTVIFDGEELLLEEFFKILNNNLGEDYAVYYEDDTDRFKVIFDGVKYSLMLDKIIMNNYKFGIYNSFTYELKKLVDKTTEFEQEGADIEETILREEEIIKDAEKGLLLNGEARKVYLEYLKNNKKFSFSKIKIKSYVSNLVDDIRDSSFSIKDWLLETNIWFFSEMWLGIEYFDMTLIGSFLIALSVAIGVGIKSGIDGFFNLKYLYWFLLGLLPQTTYLVPAVKFLGIYTMIRFDRLRDFIKNKKLVNYKIKQLTSELKYGPSELVDKTYTELPNGKDAEKPTSAILQELSEVASRIKYLKEEDKKVCFDMAMAILDEYTKRAKEINLANSSEGIVLALDGDLPLKSDMMSKIKQLSDQIAKRMDVDIKNKGIDNDYKIVSRQIEGYYYYSDDKVVGGERSRVRKSTDK